MKQIHTERLSKEISFNMVCVEGGTFMMGDNEGVYGDEKPAHQVALEGFYMGEFPVTQAVWREVMEENASPSFFLGDQRPVEQISWYEAVAFCNALSEKLGLEKVYQIIKGDNNEEEEQEWEVTADFFAKGYRLPTEAEWEYAARGGKLSKGYTYAGSNKLEEVGWYRENSDEETKHVGQLYPNELGLYDMSGNVYEWCWDWFSEDYYKKSAELGTAQNPQGAESGDYRVLRGGDWLDSARDCRSAYRSHGWPVDRDYLLGFRLVLSPQSGGG